MSHIYVWMPPHGRQMIWVIPLGLFTARSYIEKRESPATLEELTVRPAAVWGLKTNRIISYKYPLWIPRGDA